MRIFAFASIYSMKQIEVVAAIIRTDARVFATQRGYGAWKDWWEFPGGKIEEGECPEEALVREIREELSAEITVGPLLKTVEWDYPEFHLILHCYLCSLASSSVLLNEHEAARWLGYSDLWSVRWLPADEQLLPLLAAALLEVPEPLAVFIENEIIPRYAHFDLAHREDHARAVVERALALAAFYPVRKDLLYAAAACHDIGLPEGREIHHLASGKQIRACGALQKFFTPEEIETIARAAEDHRASASGEPRSLYGRIVAEADRLIVPETILRRTVQYGLSHYPELDRDGHWARTCEHLQEKYAEGGYLKLWIPESDNAASLERLRGIIRDKVLLREYFDRLYDELAGCPL